MSVRGLALSLALLLAGPVSSSAQTVTLEFADGKVTLVARDAPVRVILAEWARLGGTRIVNGEGVPGGPVSLELTNTPERQALDILLRGVAGYMLTARETGGGASHYDRLMILPTSAAPRPAPAAAALTPPAPRPPLLPPGRELDDTSPFVDPAELPPGAVPRPVVNPGQITGTPATGVTIIRDPADPFMPAPPPPPPAPPTFTPPPPSSNPFMVPMPGSARPGEITPVPQQDTRPGAPPPPDR